MNVQQILDATALIAGGALARPGVYKGVGGIAGVKVAYSDPPESKSLGDDGLVHVSFWDGHTKLPPAGDLAVYTHRIRMQLMLSAGRSDLPTAYRLLTPMASLYETAFNANIQLKGTCSSSYIESSPGIVEAIYPNRLAIEFILSVTRKEAVNNVA